METGRPVHDHFIDSVPFAEAEDELPLVAGLIAVAGGELLRPGPVAGPNPDGRADGIAACPDTSQPNSQENAPYVWCGW